MRGLLDWASTPEGIGLLSAAYVNLAWAGLTDMTQWVAAVIGFAVLLVMMRWG